MSKLAVRAVLFDLWGTLVYNIPHRALFGEVAEAAGVAPEILWRGWGQFGQASLRGRIKSGEERARLTLEYLDRPLETFAKTVPLLAAFEREMRNKEVQFYPGAEEMLNELQRRGYKIGLISNCSYLTPPVVEELGLNQKMDVVVLSCLSGYVKPEREIYFLATEKLQVSPNECLYVGDGGDNEMVGAKELGCITALVEQERGHAFRYPDKDFDTDYRLPMVTAVLDYLENAPD